MRRCGSTAGGEGAYASWEDFANAFESERLGLQRLALLLTADWQTAKRCLILSLRECSASSSVSKGWALSWARRLVIRNAINLTMSGGDKQSGNTDDEADNRFIALAQVEPISAFAEFRSVLDLPECDRFVFVICVLEGYSIYDCALLMGMPPGEINKTRERVASQVEKIDQLVNKNVLNALAQPAHSGGTK